jgi:hypothetical protein
MQFGGNKISFKREPRPCLENRWIESGGFRWDFVFGHRQFVKAMSGTIEQVGGCISQFKEDLVHAFRATRKSLALHQNGLVEKTMRRMSRPVKACFWNGIAGAVSFHIVVRF